MSNVIKIIKKILFIAVIIFAVFMMVFTIISVTVFDRIDKDLFGYHAFIVLSDSMSATDFSAGDLIFVKKVNDPSALKAGDIISYKSANIENFGEIVTHKIREVVTTKDGELGFITYGTTTDIDDETIVTYAYILGKYEAKLVGAGKFFQFLKTTPGYIICIFLPFLVLILMQGINSFRLFRKYKSEQLAEIKEEQDKHLAEVTARQEQLEAERAESQKLLAELMQLKQQLSNSNGNNNGDNSNNADTHKSNGSGGSSEDKNN